MFWIYSLDYEYPAPSYSNEEYTYSGGNNIGGNGSNPNNITAIIFNTGNFVEEGCSCNSRIVLVYRYDTTCVEAQFWKEDASGKYVVYHHFHY